MISQATDYDFKDVSFPCIPILNVTSGSELSSVIRHHASELFGQESSTLKRLIAQDLTQESWIDCAEQMVQYPEFDKKEQRAYICLKMLGQCSDDHEQVLTLLATKLMAQAPTDYPVQKTVVSSDESLSNPNTWMVYRNGQLVESNH